MIPLSASASRRMMSRISVLDPMSTPAVGSSHDEYVGFGRQPLGNHNLLLVTAGQQPDGFGDRVCLDLQPLDGGLHNLLSPPVVDHTAALQFL